MGKVRKEKDSAWKDCIMQCSFCGLIFVKRMHETWASAQCRCGEDAFEIKKGDKYGCDK